MRASHSTNEFAGDGTTTSAVLVNSILKEGIKVVENGAHPMLIKEGMDIATEKIKEYIQKVAVPLTSNEQLRSICNVSSNYDNEIADCVSKVLSEVGVDSNVEFDISLDHKTYSEIIKGYHLDRGYSSIELSGGSPSVPLEFENCLIALVEGEITSTKSVAQLIELAKLTLKPMVIFSGGIIDEPLSSLVYNIKHNNLKISAVNLPMVGVSQKEILEDIAAVTNGKVVGNTKNPFELIDTTHLGRCKKIVLTGATTTIHGGSKNQAMIDSRVADIKKTISIESSEVGRTLLRNRISSLLQRIAYINIGGRTDVEKFELRDKITDALNSGKFAMEFGIVAGGGATLIHAAKTLSEVHLPDEEQQCGVDIIKNALYGPTIQIINNSHLVGKHFADCISKLNYPMGYDVRKQAICNMIECGIIDPCKVVTTCIEDAVSIAGLILSTECILVREKQFKLDKTLSDKFNQG